jgi:hypothetical protein
MATPPTITGIEPEEVRGDVMRLLPPLERALRASAACLSQGLTLSQNVQAHIREITFTVPDDWVPVTFAAGWANAGAPDILTRWRKGDDGRVRMEGRFSWVGPPGAPVNDQAVATVPSGWAPAARYVFAMSATGGDSRLQIGTDGVLRWNNALAPFTNISPSGVVEYDAADRRPETWASPLVLEVPVQWEPAYVRVLGSRYAGEQLRRWTGAGSVLWQAAQVRAGVRRVEIQRILGLAPTQKYTLVVGVFPE